MQGDANKRKFKQHYYVKTSRWLIIESIYFLLVFYSLFSKNKCLNPNVRRINNHSIKISKSFYRNSEVCWWADKYMKFAYTYHSQSYDIQIRWIYKCPSRKWLFDRTQRRRDASSVLISNQKLAQLYQDVTVEAVKIKFRNSKFYWENKWEEDMSSKKLSVEHTIAMWWYVKITYLICMSLLLKSFRLSFGLR